MKMNFTKSIIFFLAITFSCQLFAQTDSVQISRYVEPFARDSAYRTWSIGLNGGILTQTTVFGGHYDFKYPHMQVGYGGYLKKQILPSFGLQLDYFGGKLSSSTTDDSISKFNTTITWAVSLQANVTLFTVNWRHNKSFLQPYITIGGGLMGYSPKDYSYKYPNTAIKSPDGKSSYQNYYIPVGGGLKIDLFKGVNLDLGYQVNFVNASNVDAYTSFNEPYPTRDKFTYIHGGLEFALGKRHKPQLATHNPVSSMRTEYLYQTQVLQASIDSQKATNEQLKTDLATANQSLAKTNALVTKVTTDSDNDGVPDLFDKCPGTPAGVKVDGSGCPLPRAEDVKVYISESDKKIVNDAIADLEFDTGKATIRDHSLPSLDKLADLLITKNFSLKLAGHTDNIGNANRNMKLSKDRAEAVKSYLVYKGVNASRIEATGYGQTQPIATNKTKEGRQQNRRVEFTLY